MTAPHKLTAAMRQHKPKLRSTKRMRRTFSAQRRNAPCIAGHRLRLRRETHPPPQKSPRAGATSATRSPHAWPTGTTLRATLAGLAPHKRFCAPSPAGDHKYSDRPASEPQRAPLALQVGTGASQAPYAPHMFTDRPCPASGRPPLTHARYAALRERHPAHTQSARPQEIAPRATGTVPTTLPAERTPPRDARCRAQRSSPPPQAHRPHGRRRSPQRAGSARCPHSR